MTRLLVYLRAIVGLTWSQTQYYRGRTFLAAIGVALAVLLMTLMAGLGHGVTTAGTDALQWIDRDLWMAPGSLTFAPGSVGGVRNQLVDAHVVASQIEARSDVASAGALSFQSVYASANTSSFTTLVGVGALGNQSALNVRTGPGFSTGDRYYANGSYDGPWSGEVVIDERTAAALNVSVGDTIYVGGTIVNAQRNPVEVVGVSPTFSTFLGTATVTMHLSELQELTISTANDPASIVAITVAEGANSAAVERALEEEYGYEVRSNDEQLRAFVGNNAAIIAGVFTLTVVSIASGIALIVNVLATLVQHQRRELAALRAIGVSSTTLVGAIVGQGLGIGLLGSVIGIGLAPVAAGALNGLVTDLTGFTELIRTPTWLLVAGACLAFVMGLLGAGITARQVVRVSPLKHLEP